MEYTVFMCIQAIAVLMTFVGILYMMRRKISFEQKLMLMLFVCVFIYNIGNNMLITSKNIYAARVSIQVSNMGYAYLSFLYIIFVLKYLGKKVPRLIYWGMILISTVMLFMSTVFLDSDLYYKVTAFQYSKGFPELIFDYGIVFYIYTAACGIVIIYGVIITTVAYVKCKDIAEKNRINALLNMILMVAVFFLVNEFVFPKYLDIMPIAIAADMVLLVITTEKYNLIDVVASARDQVFETMPEAVFALDENMNLRDINATGAALFPDIAECKGGPLPLKYTFLFENTDDKLDFKHGGVHFERHFSPIMYRGVLTGYCIVLIDITHTHQMMLQMQELKNKADVASESKSNFLASMSHEIRTPMNAIVGYSDLISKEVTTKEGKLYADSIRTSSNSLLHIINDILDFSKIEQGKLEILEEEYATEKLFDEVKDICGLQADRKGIKLISSVDPTTPAVLYGDKLRIRQVLLNVVGNAVKFTNEGSVRIVTEWESEEPENARLTITVSDTGIGIAEEDMNRLFKEFEQFDSRTRYVKSGIGLGLSISKSLLEMMGGTISIESEYGVGTSVIIVISQKIINRTPIASSPELADKNVAGNEKKVLIAPDARIMVVDDNRVNLELMSNYLKQYRIRPDMVDGGEESVKLASENYYDIIFMDQMMPGMDGVEAMKRIRALGGRNAAELPIIALTANAITGTRNALIQEGFTDYASKPLPLKTLEYLLTKYLPQGTYTISAEVTDSESVSDVAKGLASKANVLELPDYIDQKIGMTNAGDDFDQYRSTVEIVHKYAGEKIENIVAQLAREDYKAFTIEVHALKSNAATVGAMRLADKARALETAGKADDIETIKRDSAGFIEEYRSFAADLEKALTHVRAVDAETLFEEEVSAPMSAGDEEYFQTFEEIELAVNEQRYDDAKDLFEVLGFFELPPVTTHAVAVMKEGSGRADWQSVLDILRKLR